MSTLVLTAGILFVLWGVVSSMVIVSFLSRRGVKINFFFLRLFLPKYVGQYRKLTVDETGKPGFWYYSFVTSMILALVLVGVGLFLRVL